MPSVPTYDNRPPQDHQPMTQEGYVEKLLNGCKELLETTPQAQPELTPLQKIRFECLFLDRMAQECERLYYTSQPLGDDVKPRAQALSKTYSIAMIEAMETERELAAKE